MTYRRPENFNSKVVFPKYSSKPKLRERALRGIHKIHYCSRWRFRGSRKTLKKKTKYTARLKKCLKSGENIFLTRAVLAVTATGWRSAKWYIFVKANISPKTWILKYSKCVNWICQVYPAKIQPITLEKLNTWPSTHRYEAVTTELCETCNLNRRWWSESKAFGCAKTSSTNICFQGSWSVKSQGYCDVVSVKKSPLLKCFPSTIKRKAGVFKFVWFEERFPFSKKSVFATA